MFHTCSSSFEFEQSMSVFRAASFVCSLPRILYVRVFVCMYVCACVCLYVCMCVCLFVCMYACVFV